MNQIFTEWGKLQLWEQFMKPEAFCVILTIEKCVPPNLRQEAIEDILKYLKDDLKGVVPNNAIDQLGPLRTRLIDFMKFKQEAIKGCEDITSSNSSNNNRQPYHGKGQYNNNKYQQNSHSTNGKDETNNGNANSSLLAYKAMSGNSAKCTSLIDPEFCAPIDRCVLPKDKVGVKVGNEIVVYIASFSACPKCYPSDSTKTSSPHSPKCSAVKCDRCDLFGHSTNICCQQDSFGFRKALKK